jgi:hypothetical protein
MNPNNIASGLAIIAGLFCLSSFLYQWVKHAKQDYMILAAGVFMIALGIGWLAKNRTLKK